MSFPGKSSIAKLGAGLLAWTVSLATSAGMAATTEGAASPNSANRLSTFRSKYLENPLAVSLSLEKPSLGMRFKPKSDDGRATKETWLKPNAHVLWGLGLDYNGYGAVLALPLAQDQESVQRKGSTEHFDLILHRYWSGGGVDFFFESYKGFYRSNDGSSGDNDNSTYTQHADVAAIHTGLNYYYVFSPDRYNIDVQVRERPNPVYAGLSGGSLIALLALDYNKVSATSPFLKVEDGAGAIDSHDLILAGEFSTATVGGGYGYTFIRGSHSVRGQLLMGLGPQQQHLTSLDRTETTRTMTATKANLSSDYAFFWRNNIFGVNVRYDDLRTNLSSYEMSTTVTSVFFYGLWRI